jgi:succinate dehydrogenase/fumarate reductase flavoprotein subunit
LSKARQYVADERARLAGDLLIMEPMDHVLAFEHRNLLDVAEVIIEAGSMRCESRGSHYRSDCPRRDDSQWLTNIFASKKNEQLELRKKWVCSGDGWTDEPGDVRIKPWG